MIRFFRIKRLQWREFWQEFFADIERSRLHDSKRNLEEMEKRLSRTRFDLDRLHAPQSLIMAALQRRSKG